LVVYQMFCSKIMIILSLRRLPVEMSECAASRELGNRI
jgi:hypothetical protein